MSNEELSKSIDAMIDELFGEELEKAPGDIGYDSIGEAEEEADKGEKPAKGQDDDKRGAGRPKDISDVPDVDRDGNRAKGYDAIQAPDKAVDNPEAKQVNKNAKEVFKKSYEISPEEYEEFMALRKSEEEKIMDELRKSFMAEQKDLIKSAVSEATYELRRENEGLQKSLNEQGELVKAIARKPQSSKSITSVQALEKSQAAPKEEFFSKSDMLDVAEGLFKSGKLRDSHVIELENNGYIYDNNARAVLENELKRR